MTMAVLCRQECEGEEFARAWCCALGGPAGTGAGVYVCVVRDGRDGRERTRTTWGMAPLRLLKDAGNGE